MKSILFSVLLSATLLLTGCFRSTADNKAQANAITDSTNVQQQVKPIFKLETVDDLYSFMTYDADRYPLISAHRGGPVGGYPENAIETFDYLAEQMPAIIECDVRLSKDGVMVLMHDETLDRTSTGSGAIQAKTFAELQQLWLKDNDGVTTKYKIPTLEEALRWGKHKVIFTLDVKKDVSYKKLSALVKQLEAQAYAIVITYNANQAIAVHRADPDLMISVSLRNEADLKRLQDAGIPTNRLVAFVGTRVPDQGLVRMLHEQGIKTILGTMGNLDRQAEARGYQVYAEYVEKGADILSTDRPFEAQKALDFYIQKRQITSPYINH